MRRLAALSLLLLTLVLLTACSFGSPEPDTPPTSLPTPEPIAEKEPTAEPASPTATSKPTRTPTPSPTFTPTRTSTPTPSPTPTLSPDGLGGLSENAKGLLTLTAPDCRGNNTIESIEAASPTDVIFTMCDPDPAFPAKAAFEGFGIQPIEQFLTTEGKGKLLTHPIGTGPYALEKWKEDEEIILKRFDDYWGDPALDKTVVFRWNKNGIERLIALRDELVDQIAFVAPDDTDLIAEERHIQLLPWLGSNILYMGMNNQVEPFDNLTVRRALAMGIDRDALIEEFYPQGSQVATHFTPCHIPNGCEGDDWYDFNPTRAKSLLASAGYPNGFETSIYYRDAFRLYLPEPSLVAEAIQEQLEENLGIIANPRVLNSYSFVDRIMEGELEGMYLLGWGAYYPHVSNFLDPHFNRRNRQFGRPIPDIYRPLGQAAKIPNSERTKALYNDANQAIRANIPMIPIAHGAALDAALTTTKGATLHPNGQLRAATIDTPDNSFTYLQAAEPQSLYCADEIDSESLRVCAQIVEPLLTYAPDSSEPIPHLATSCDPNTDGTIWRCSLRQNVLFHDGSTLDANDVVMSYAVALDGANPLHVGNSGEFWNFADLWGLMNVEEEEEEE